MQGDCCSSLNQLSCGVPVTVVDAPVPILQLPEHCHHELATTPPYTVVHNCHIKNKFPTSNTNSPHQKQIPHIKIKFTTSNTNSPQQKQNRRCKSKFTTSKTNLSHQKRTCHSKNKWHVVFPGTPEHRTPEHRNTETSRNTPKTRNTPKKTRNTSQKTRNTSEFVCKILRIPPRIEVRNRPLMKRQKPRKVILILQSHKLENFTIFTISKIVTSASHSHFSIFLRAYLYERANEENGGGEGKIASLQFPSSSTRSLRLQSCQVSMPID